MVIHNATRGQSLLKRVPAARQRPVQQNNAAEELISTPSNLLRTRRSIAVKDELDEDFDMFTDYVDETFPSRRGGGFKFAAKVLKEVVIPVPQYKAPNHRGRPISTESPSSASSVLSSCHDQSSEYDTPGTSAVATPAESIIKAETSSRLSVKGNTTALMQQQRTSKLSFGGANGKRKREEVDEFAEDTIEADALLAQALQEEEYQEAGPNRSKSAKSRKFVEDPEDEGDYLSDLSDEPAFDPFTEVGRQKAMSMKTAGRISLPNRAARESARKSIADKASLGIMDTDDSDLSDYISEFDSEDFESEDSVGDGDEDLFQQSDIAAAGVITVAPGTAASARRRNRIRRPRTTPNSTAVRSWMASRVRLLLSWLVIPLNIF